MSQFFMHQKSDLVSEAIEGALIGNPWHSLSLLDAGPDIRVVVRNDWDKKDVALISGGGSGHEPAHVGFVGKGMLTAAVCGDIFASPSVEAVLSAIINVTGEKGCLLIVKNYTGDRLNFGLAAEKAKKLGFKVELVMVTDDIALPDNPQPRGIAGTALIHKVAGYAAASGKSLEEVMAAANEAIAATASLGLAFSSCHVPGEKRDERVKEGQSELGMGIHGEPGASTLKTQDSREIVALMAAKLAEHNPDNKKTALLINNLGGFSSLEMAVLTREVLRSPLGKQVDLLIGPATLVSALDMKGFSLSTLLLTDALAEALQAPVEASGWQPASKPAPLNTRQGEKVARQQHFAPSENASTAAIVATVCRTLAELETELNQLDAKVGDGDTGSTFAAGAKKILAELEANRLPLNEPENLLTLIGEELAVVMGGSSGVLMSIMFTAAGQKLEEGEALPQALSYGLERMQHYGGARPGDRTMIDALDPAFAALTAGKSREEAAQAAKAGAEKTAQMSKAQAGRSSYLNQESLHGVKDPGAYAVEQVFARLAAQQ
ncbi:dihydroxyacetone kinase [Erwinia persicina]|jgi:dihydroxyacetone kinase|uniref:Dihydroxyacetone kinase subunit DhaK n=1 Tax=Erwinia plantamica TaxID=3237104 RepID=A0ABW7CKQ1_9GAMM|nr:MULTISPECIES: dihydroxyacetone kinase subunit DhaK [Erwinia]MCP1438598.1 dihydroxyacetone kinase [Erwinia persicina]MDN4627762.1 dihydroxyacetone kinase subunit DhaK [Erwinia sp. PsM31]MDN8542226.1 dihydroxyacetone kinase subunit DhaK [Erwinia sp. BC051422]